MPYYVTRNAEGAIIGWRGRAALGEVEESVPANDPDLLAFHLVEQRARAMREIDHAAGNARLLFITSGAGQEMEYLESAKEADALIAAGGSPVAADYPMLQASIGIDGATVSEVAATIIARRDAWKVSGAAIKQIRLTAKAAVQAAADAAEITALVDAIVWPPPEAEERS